MPVDRLIVEGDLDAEILAQVLAGKPAVENASSSKDALPPRTRAERRRTQTNTCYLRDRDFDYDPPADRSAPPVDQMDHQHKDVVLGWHWCRHEMENYLLQPEIVSVVLGCKRDEYDKSLLAAASQIGGYEASRWAVGTARRALPPHYELRTRPEDAGDSEFFLPTDLSPEHMKGWAICHTSAYALRSQSALTKNAVAQVFDSKYAFFQESVLMSVPEVLVWLSGKDLIAAMVTFWQLHGLDNPGAFRAKARDWMREHPEDVVRTLPEWQSLLRVLRA